MLRLGIDLFCNIFFLVDCEWLEAYQSRDCKKEQEDYFNKTDTESQRGCYKSKVLQTFAKQKMKREGAEFANELQGMMKKMQESNSEDVFPWNFMELKSLGTLMKDRDNDLVREISRYIPRDWSEDRDQIVRMMLSTTAKYAEVPVLDGLYGGKACERATDKSRDIYQDLFFL